jgi:signal transduction histidine kinase
VKRLHEIIRARRKGIIQRWRTHVARSVAGESMPSQELIDTLPVFLDRLADVLEQAVASGVHPGPELEEVAIGHGIQRMHLGFNPSEIAREYGIVRDAVIEESLAADYTPDLIEMWTMAKALAHAIGTALTSYMAEREQERDRLAGEHLAFLAHELRNPLHAARMALQLAAKTDEARRAAVLASAERGVRAALHRLDNTLASVRMRAHPQARPEKVDPGELLHQSAEDARAIAENSGMSIEFEVEEGLELNADPRLLGSALGNLVLNAAKFTRQGGRIVLRARKVQGRVRFEVEDECGGLPPGTAERLFDPFVQMGKDRSGFGLGLAIAKQATQAHHGNLSVHDLPGKGCVFLLEVPIVETP